MVLLGPSWQVLHSLGLLLLPGPLLLLDALPDQHCQHLWQGFGVWAGVWQAS